MDSPNAQSAPHGGAIDRFERAVTLLLATSALAAVALIGWGGFVLDLGPIGAILVTLVRESASGHMVEPGVGDAIARVRWEDLGPLAGTVVTLLFCWHAISLAAESVLLLASSCGWLWNTSLRPLWAILDVLNSAPLAAPKRLIVATALASQMLVRSAGPSLAASPPSKLSVAVVVDQVAQDPSGPSRPSEDTPSMAEPAPPGAYVARTVIGKKIELYRWLAEEHWERASGRLEAFGREMMGLLARAYRDAGRNEDALLMYAQLFAEDPLDRGAHEGLLLAAAGTGDVAQLHEAWQQICVCLGGEGDLEIRGLYERLLRELERAPNPERTGSPVGVGGGSLRQISSPVVRVTADEGLLSAPPPMTQPSGGLDAR
jgi:hypothetical protein